MMAKLVAKLMAKLTVKLTTAARLRSLPALDRLTGMAQRPAGIAATNNAAAAQNTVRSAAASPVASRQRREGAELPARAADCGIAIPRPCR
jgi:hypothetical protein